jgi:putative two-component system response regulator
VEGILLMAPHSACDERILIVDDEQGNITLLERMLGRAGYQKFRSTKDPRQVVDIFTEFQPDIIFLDLVMPELDGFEVMTQLQQLIPEGCYLPILILTGDSTPETKSRALSQGAADFLTKPFDLNEIILRTRNMLRTRSLHLQIQSQKMLLEEKVVERTRELEARKKELEESSIQLEEARLEIVRRLAVAVEYRDDDTGEHTIRVGANAARVAGLLSFSESDIQLIRLASPLHDVGKVGIPDDILLKKDRLNEEEFTRMKQHTVIGAMILSRSRFKVIQVAETIAHFHHEKWNGAGYPEGLKGESIPIEARITQVVDVFDALTHKRPYKKEWSVEDASNELRKHSGDHFDPAVVNAFLEGLRRGHIAIAEVTRDDMYTEYERLR